MDTLYNLTGQYLDLIALSDSIEPEEEQLFIDTLEGLSGEIALKADAYVNVIQSIEAKSKMFDDEIKRLQERKETMQNNVARMKATLMNSMEVMGVDKIEGQYHTLSIQKNGGKVPIIYDNDKQVPASYQKTEVIYSTDTNKVRKALEEGQELSFARLGVRGKHIRIK